MIKKVTLAVLHRAAEFQEIEGRNDLELCIDYVRKCTPGGDKLNHDQLFFRGRELHRHLAAGDEVSTEPTGLPTLGELAEFPGSSDLEKAIAYLEATLGEPFEALDDASKKGPAQDLLGKIEKAGADLPDDETAEDPTLSRHEQARRNLMARSPKFRALSNEQQSFGPEVRAEADRIRRLRDARSEGATHALADDRSVVPPRAPITPQPGQEPLPTLAEIRRLPPVKELPTDVGRAITWLGTQTNGAFLLNPWEVQVREACTLIRNIYAREGVRPAAPQETVRNPFGSRGGYSVGRV
jgi:hypothetical protein